MATATTTLPLFWHLSSADKSARIDASVKLVSALQLFQDNFIAEARQEDDEDDNKDNEAENDEEYELFSSKLDTGNAADVAYAIRRLIRGLASPRESSRLGFAVALTELLSRIDTVSCQQVLVLLRTASQTMSNMSGQEERDMLFARLFGLKSIIQSGLLFREKPLRMSSTSSGSLKAYEIFVSELLALGEKKSWLRESCWWTLISAVDALDVSSVPWKKEAFDMLFDRVFVSNKAWSPEKVALTLKLQKTQPSADWKAFCGSYFKNADILTSTNLLSLGRILKDSNSDDEDEESKHSAGPWKPQLHFVWDVIFDNLLATDSSSVSSGNFQDFYLVVVDESLFSASSSPQRKFWGFQVFQKALHRLPPAKLSLLFTKNFMRSWINQLSKNDRYLHTIARQVASDVQEIVEKDPKAGFTLVLQLTGTNGSFHFDRITKTRTVETILAKMDSDGINEYIDYLLKQINGGEENDSLTSVGARRIWIIEQMTALIRKRSIPKNDESIRLVLDWLTTHAFFTVRKKSSKSSNLALRIVPNPPLSEELHNLCKARLQACLADLASLSSSMEKKGDAKPAKVNGVAADGDFWISKLLKLLVELEKDTKHTTAVHKIEEQKLQTRNEALAAINKIKTSLGDRDTAKGAELLVCALLFKYLCDSEEVDRETLRDCISAASKLSIPANDEKTKRRQGGAEDDEGRAPIDLIVDIIIGLLDQSNSFSRAIANQSFAMMTSLMTDDTVDLILAQLERRDPSQDVDEGDEGDEEIEGEESKQDDTGEVNDDSDSFESSGEDDDKDIEKWEEEAESLRKALQAAIPGENMENESGSDDSSDAASMDDEQMMQFDEKLAAVFRTRAEEGKKGKDVGAQREATYFKNRVLDLVEAFMKKQPTSNLVMRFILPLVEIVSTASSDEKQLSDKAKSILRSRMAKTRDAPAVDAPKAIELLESLHQRARKAHNSDVVATISLCSLFVMKALSTIDKLALAVRIYKESCTDFITRKASALNLAFILDFVRRYPIQAWSIRSSLVEATANAVNGYRQTQALNIIQTIFISLPQSDLKREEAMTFMSLVSKTFLDVISSSCSSDKPALTTAQMKDTLKLALQLCRFSKRFANDMVTTVNMWQPESWSKLATALSLSEHFKASTSLAKACQQIAHLVQTISPSSSKTTVTLKRKQDGDAEDADATEPKSKPKRRKVRKFPKASKG